MKIIHAIIIIVLDFILIMLNSIIILYSGASQYGLVSLPYMLVNALFIYFIVKKYSVNISSQLFLTRHILLLMIPVVAYVLAFITKPVVFINEYSTYIENGSEGICIPGIEFSTWESIQYFIMVGLLGPILEEFLFRGVILNQLFMKYSPYGVIVLISVLFGLLHGPPSMIAAIFLSIVSSFIYLYSKSILLSILFHSSYNLSLYIQGHQENLLNNGFFFSKIYLFLIIPLSIGLIVFFLLRMKRFYRSQLRSGLQTSINDYVQD